MEESKHRSYPSRYVFVLIPLYFTLESLLSAITFRKTTGGISLNSITYTRTPTQLLKS